MVEIMDGIVNCVAYCEGRRVANIEISKISEMTSVPTPRCCFCVRMDLREGANSVMGTHQEIDRCVRAPSPGDFV